MIKDYFNLPRTVIVLCIGTLINRAGAFLLPFLTLYLRDRLGLSEQFATMTMGAFGAGAVVASLVGGSLADRLGRKAVMVVSLYGGAAVLIAFPFANSSGQILVSVVLFSLLAEMYRPAASAMIADVTPSEQRVHAFGLMYLAINLGFTLAAVVGGALAAYSFKALFWGDAGTAIIYGIIILWLVKETKPPQSTIANNDVSAPTWKHILGNRVFLMFCFGCFLLATVYMQGLSTFPLYLSASGIGPQTYGHLVAINGIMIVCLQVPITSMVSKRHCGAMLSVAAVLTAIGFGLIGWCTNTTHFAMTVVIWTLGEMVQAPIMPTVVSNMSPPNMRARYQGMFSVCYASANVVGAPLGGWVLTHHGGQTLWTLTFVVAMLPLALFAVIWHHLGQNKDAGP